MTGANIERLSVAEAASLAGVASQTVRAWLAEGVLAGTKTAVARSSPKGGAAPKTAWSIKRSDLESFLARRAGIRPARGRPPGSGRAAPEPGVGGPDAALGELNEELRGRLDREQAKRHEAELRVMRAEMDTLRLERDTLRALVQAQMDELAKVRAAVLSAGAVSESLVDAARERDQTIAGFLMSRELAERSDPGVSDHTAGT